MPGASMMNFSGAPPPPPDNPTARARSIKSLNFQNDPEAVKFKKKHAEELSSLQFLKPQSSTP